MVRLILATVLILAAAFFMLPLFHGILHIGMIYPACLFVLAALALIFPEKTAMLFHGRFRLPAIALAAVIGIFTVYTAVILSAMGIAAAKPVPKESKVTVVVLGCQVRGTTPSLMLNDRIKAAYKYLAENEDSVCVASGGKGDNEDISEAQCIKNELIKRGIAENRIYIEDKSRNTHENLEFTAKIIEQNNLSRTTAIASDNFHQLRASIFAKNVGLSPSSLGCPTVWYLTAGYWTREVLAVTKALIFGK